METGLLHDLFGNFSTRGEKYYFCMEGSTPDEIEPPSQPADGGGGPDGGSRGQMADGGVISKHPPGTV